MLDYLTCKMWHFYNPNFSPSANTSAGGMASATYRTLEALSEVYPATRVISNTKEISAGTLVIEPLILTMPPAEGDETHDEIIKGIESYKGKKILYCSEKAMLRMAPPIRQRLVAAVDCITANCLFQRDIFKYIGVNVQHILPDPIPLHFVPHESVKKEKKIVAMGNISHEKNTPQLIEVFKALNGQVERVYIGSCGLWNPDTSKNHVGLQLQEQLYAECDTVVNDVPERQVVEMLVTSQFGFWCAIHDVFSTCIHEMLMSGLLCVTANHGLAKYLPVNNVSGAANQISEIQRLITLNPDVLRKQSSANVEWAQENVSYPAFLDKFATVLKGVW